MREREGLMREGKMSFNHAIIPIFMIHHPCTYLVNTSETDTMIFCQSEGRAWE